MFLQNLRRSVGRWSLFFSSSSLSTRRLSFFALPNIQHNSLLFQNPCRFVDVSLKPTSPLALSHRFLSSSVTQNKDHYEEHPLQRKLRFSYFHAGSIWCFLPSLMCIMCLIKVLFQRLYLLIYYLMFQSTSIL